MLVVWQQPKFLQQRIQCRDCYAEIFDGEIIEVEPFVAVKLFAEGESNSAGNYSQKATCTRCAINDNFHISNGPFLNAVKQIIEDSAAARKGETEEAIRSIVREELKRILREEAFDPHGTVSPE